MDDRTLQEIIDNSFLDLHSKGLDYICLKRSPKVTDKVYFFGFDRDFDMASQPEVVNPHDHRYDFDTLCLSGAIANSVYRRVETARLRPSDAMYEEFEWRTPLNGGDGFSWKRTSALRRRSWKRYSPGNSYFMPADEIHTIHVRAPETCIMLRQHEDVVPIDRPTSTFMREGAKAPSLDGLYRKPTADDVLRRLAWLAPRLALREMASTAPIEKGDR